MKDIRLVFFYSADFFILITIVQPTEVLARQSTDNINKANPCVFHVIYRVTLFASPPLEDPKGSAVFIMAEGRCQENIPTIF